MKAINISFENLDFYLKIARSGNSRRTSSFGNNWPELSTRLPAGDFHHLLRRTRGPAHVRGFPHLVACLAPGGTDWKPQAKAERWDARRKGKLCLSVHLYNGVCTGKVGQEVRCNWPPLRTETWFCRTWLREMVIARRTPRKPMQVGAPRGIYSKDR